MKRILLLLTALGGLLTACSNRPASTTNTAADSLSTRLARNKAIIMASERALASKNVDLILKDCAPGYTEYNDGQSKPITNMDTIKKNFQAALDAIEIKGEDMTAIASGDSVLVTGTWSGKFSKPYMGVPANGKTFKFADVDIFVMNKEGKILSHRSTQTSAEMLKQLGLLKPALTRY